MQQKYNLKKYFDNLTDEELVVHFKRCLYDSYIKNTVDEEAVFWKIKDFDSSNNAQLNQNTLNSISKAIDLQMLIEMAQPSIRLDFNICLICCQYSAEYIIDVLAIDHNHGPSQEGRYFHFERAVLVDYLGGKEKLRQWMRFKVRIRRTDYIGFIIIWPNNNGGSRGDTHGRFDKDPIGNPDGYFQIGDQIEILEKLNYFNDGFD